MHNPTPCRSSLFFPYLTPATNLSKLQFTVTLHLTHISKWGFCHVLSKLSLVSVHLKHLTKKEAL